MTGRVSSTAGSAIDFSAIKFVFLDRDGVINQKAPAGAYVTAWKDIHILPGAEQAIALLNHSSHKVIVVTNQRGIALQYMSETDLLSIHEHLQFHLGTFGAHIDAIYYCPHDLGQCSCRKPGTGLFERAFHDFPEAHSGNSVMIGDSDSDIVAGTSLGMKTILVGDWSEPATRLTAKPSASGQSLLDVVETYLN